MSFSDAEEKVLERWGMWIARQGEYTSFDNWLRFTLGGEDLMAAHAYLIEAQEKPLADILDAALSTADLDAPDPVRFYGKKYGYRELSNFHGSLFFVGALPYTTVEHYYQASKALSFADHERIRKTETPAEAKRMGQKVELRSNWENLKEDFMRVALASKFRAYYLQSFLLKTENREIIEASPTDYYWGEGRKGNGKNRLGVLLMEVRDALREDRLDQYMDDTLSRLRFA